MNQFKHVYFNFKKSFQGIKTSKWCSQNSHSYRCSQNSHSYCYSKQQIDLTPSYDTLLHISDSEIWICLIINVAMVVIFPPTTIPIIHFMTYLILKCYLNFMKYKNSRQFCWYLGHFNLTFYLFFRFLLKNLFIFWLKDNCFTEFCFLQSKINMNWP